MSEFIALDEASAADYAAACPRHTAVNVGGVVLTAAALPHLRDNGRRIVIGSVNAHQMPFPGIAVYGGSKAAAAALDRGWARDLGPRGTLTNVIQPGPIETEMSPNVHDRNHDRHRRRLLGVTASASVHEFLQEAMPYD